MTQKKSPKPKTNPQAKDQTFRLLFANHPTPMWVYDLKTLAFLDVNDAALEKYGYTRGEFLTLTLKDIRPAEDVGRLSNNIEQKRPSLQHSGEWRHRLKNGQLINVEITSHTLEFEGHKAALVMAQDITERKQAEEILRESERKLREAQEMAHLGFWLWDVKTGDVEWSEEVFKIFCLDPKEFTPRIDSILALSPWDEDRQRDKELINRAIETHSPGSYEQKFLRPDQSIGHYYSTFQGNYDENGDLVSIVGTVLDITERKQAEENYRNIFENSLDGIFQSTPEGRFITVNPAFARMLGYESPGELIETITDIASQIYVESAQRAELMQIMAEQGSVNGFEYQMKRKDGGVIWVSESVRAAFDRTGKILYYEGTAEDITKRKQAEVAQQQSELQFRSLFELSPDAVILIDPHDPNLSWPIVDCNAAACLMNGYRRDEFIGHSIDIVNTTPGTRTERNAYLKQLREAGNLKTETVHRHKNGTVFPIEVSTTLIKVGDRELIIGIDRDITERKQADIEIKERTQDLELINAMNEAVMRGDNLKSVMELFAKELRKISVCKDSSIHLLSPDGKNLVMQHLSISPTVLKKIEQLTGRSLPQVQVPIKEDGYFQQILQSEQGIIATDPKIIQNWMREFTETKLLPTAIREAIRKRIPQIYKLLDIRSILFLPLVSDKKVIGLLNVSSAEVLTEKDMKRIQKISGQLTAVILREQANEALLESEERYRSIFDGVQDAIFIESKDGRIVGVNTRACEMYGYSRDEFLGKTVSDLVPEGSAIFPLSGIQPNIFPSPFETINRRANGDLFPIEISGGLQILNGEEIFLVIVRDITERKKTEEALQQAEAKYRNIFENAIEGIFQSTPAGKFFTTNQALARMLGYDSPEQLIASVNDLNHNFYVQPGRREEFIRQLNDSGMIANFESEVYRKDGSTIWMSENARIMHDDLGQTIYYEGTFEDITKRKQAEESLRRSEELLRVTLANILDPVFITKNDGEFTFICPNVPDALGYSVEEIQAMDNISKLVGDDLFSPEELEMRGEITNIERVIVDKRGRQRFFLTNVKRVTIGEGTRLYVLRDITERKQAELALEESQRRLATLMASLPGMAFRCKNDPEWTMDFVSEGCYPLTGYHPAELINNASIAYGQIIHPQDRQVVWDVIQAKLEEKQPYRLISLLVTPGGEERWVWEQGQGIYRADGNLLAIEGFIADITERKQAEDALRESEAFTKIVLNNLPIGIAVNSVDPTVIFSYMNDNFPKFYRTTREKLAAPDAFWSAVYEEPDFREEIKKRVLDDVASGDPQRMVWVDVPITRKGEETAYITARNIPIPDKSLIISTVWDVTERKQAEDTLKKERAHLEKRTTELGVALRETEGLFSTVQDILTSTHLTQICQSLMEHFIDLVKAERITLYLVDHQHQEILLSLSSGNSQGVVSMTYQELNAGISGQVFKSGQPVLSLSADDGVEPPETYERRVRDNVGSLIVVPLLTREGVGKLRVIGTVTVVNRTDQRSFTHHEKDLLMMMATQAAAAIENIRLYEETSQRVKELELLYESGLMFSQLLNPKEIAKKIIELLGRKLNWHHTAIRLIRGQDELELVAFDQPGIGSKIEKRTIEAHFNKLITRVGEGLSGWALQESRIVRSGDVGSNPHYVATYPGLHSGLYVPLKSGNHVLGVISIESEKPNAFSEADELLIATLASQAANAFENARLYEEVSRYAEDLEQRVQERTAEIESTRQRLELAVRTAGIGIWELDSKQNKDYWDDRLFTLYGLSKESALASPETWHNAVHPDDLAQQLKLMDEALHNNQPYNAEFRVIWPDGSIHYIKSTGIIIHDEAGIPERMIGANQDITIHKQAEETLRLANAEMERGLRIKNEFLANMSHELRTPLNAILGISESLEEQISGILNEKQLKYIHIISESGRHLLDMINDILDLSKIEAGKLELNIQPISVEKLCTSSLRMVKELAQKKSLNISFELDETVKVISGDERRLKQSLVNLLGNAVKFTRQGKKIGLEVSGNAETNEVTFTVWDEGIGINEEDMTRLFKPFVQLNAGLTRAYAGTGLGLAVVAQIVRMHDGRINLISELNVGSRFMITLPWMPAEQGTQSPVKPQVVADKPKSSGGRTGKILIVEDAEVVAQLMSEYLRHQGYQTLIALDGQEGVLLARQEHPQIIFMDVMMPVMNGLDATRQIRADATLKDVPIIALTALAMPDDRERCLAAGMNDYLSKPIQIQELTQIIDRFLNQTNKSQTS